LAKIALPAERRLIFVRQHTRQASGFAMLKRGGFFFLPLFGEEVQRETPEITRPCASLT
jgi:hypothetical protein